MSVLKKWIDEKKLLIFYSFSTFYFGIFNIKVLMHNLYACILDRNYRSLQSHAIRPPLENVCRWLRYPNY